MAIKYSYSFRPRKQIQRLLIADACQRLRAIAPLESYEYIGFGGFEFVDFDIFRRRLGIQSMVSYEKAAAADRYEFNVPFAEISLKFGAAALHLPFIDKAQLRIVWLDYTQRLDDEVVQDIATSASRLAPGSVLIASVNAVSARPADARRASRAEAVPPASTSPTTRPSSTRSRPSPPIRPIPASRSTRTPARSTPAARRTPIGASSAAASR